MATKKRNYYLNYWKGLACFGVLFFHVRWPVTIIDGVVQAIFRFAVPLFFMVSGYFCYNQDRELLEKKLPAKMKHIFWINLVGCAYYFIFELAIGLLGDSSGGLAGVKERWDFMINVKNFVVWLVFNQDPFIYIMWFTSALLYCYLAFWVINHFNLYKLGYWCIPVLIIVHFVLGNVSGLFGANIELIYYRNFLFFGMPFFMLGNWIHTYQSMIMEKLSENSCRVLLIVGAIMSVGEWFWLGRHEMFMGSVIMVVGVFALSLYQPERKEKSFITKIGAEYSLFIYIVHYSLKLVMERFTEKILLEDSMEYYIFYFIRPFLIFGICILGAWIFYGVLSRLSKAKEK